MIDPNEVAAALWAQSKDKSLYKSWADVPQNIKDIWRASYDNFSGALGRSGYVIIPVTPSGETLNALMATLLKELGRSHDKVARAAYAAIVGGE